MQKQKPIVHLRLNFVQLHPTDRDLTWAECGAHNYRLTTHVLVDVTCTECRRKGQMQALATERRLECVGFAVIIGLLALAWWLA